MNNTNQQLSSQGRKVYTAPIITESYLTDNGEVMHILANGNEQSDISYMALWGKPKGVINWKCKGKNPDSRAIY